MVILHGSLLDCICLDDKRRIKEKEEIIRGPSHLVDLPGLDKDLLFGGTGLLVKGLCLLLNGHMILPGGHHLQDDCCINM